MKIGTRVKLSERGIGFFPASQQDRVGTVIMHEYTLVAVQWDTEAREPVTMMYNLECLEEVETLNRDTTTKQTDVETALYQSMRIEPEQVFLSSGDYSIGFYDYCLEVDLEALKDGALQEAFRVNERKRGDFVSTREYFGIVQSASLPAGVIGGVIVSLCASIWANREKYTDGLTVSGYGGNEKAHWQKDGGSLFWIYEFQEYAQGLPCLEVVDLAHDDNITDVQEALSEDIAALEVVTEQVINELMSAAYASDPQTHYINHESAAALLFSKWKNTINRDTPLYTYTADVLGLTLLDQFLGYADCTEVMQGGREQLESLLLFIAEDYKRDEVLWLNAEEAEDDLPGCAVDWRLTRFTLAGLADEIACRASEYAAR